MKRTVYAILAVLAALVVLSACTDKKDDDTAAEQDEAAAASSLERYQASQPVPEFDWSQLRQNLIELQGAQAQTTQTTTFFFNVGTPDPIAQCPSIGFPIPSTAQLTNPAQVVTPGPRERGAATIAQLEQTGIYTGDSTGTYAMCLDGSGQAYAFYWEGYVSTVTGAAEFTDGQITLIGDPTFDFSTSED